SESEDDQSASKGKVAEAQVFKGKEPVVADTATATPKRKRAGKEKAENVVEEKKKKEKVIKKQRTQKKK
ncbi:hypothetical protein A2U01_0114773, partial [Trifolium medium]|nr:hypothetical protein [Trifolium medium]